MHFKCFIFRAEITVKGFSKLAFTTTLNHRSLS